MLFKSIPCVPSGVLLIFSTKRKVASKVKQHFFLIFILKRKSFCCRLKVINKLYFPFFSLYFPSVPFVLKNEMKETHKFYKVQTIQFFFYSSLKLNSVSPEVYTLYVITHVTVCCIVLYHPLYICYIYNLFTYRANT